MKGIWLFFIIDIFVVAEGISMLSAQNCENDKTTDLRLRLKSVD